MKLERFAHECHDILKADPGTGGPPRICALLENDAAGPRVRAGNVDGARLERHVLYEDPELGFCILAHNYAGSKESPPHDHGPSWAIYGQGRRARRT